MKKVFGLFFVFVLVLTACAKMPVPTAVPTMVPTEQSVTITPETTLEPTAVVNGLTMDQLFAKDGNGEKALDTFLFVGPYDEATKTVKVEVNGVLETLIDETTGDDNSPYNLFLADRSRTYNGSKEVSRAHDLGALMSYLRKSDTGGEYYSTVVYYDVSTRCLIIGLDQYADKIVDPIVWDKTKGELAYWDGPGYILENLTTGEIAFNANVFTISDNSTFFGRLDVGEKAWGYIHTENAIDITDYDNVFISQSEADYAALDGLTEKLSAMVDYQFTGPASACGSFQYWGDDLASKHPDIIPDIIKACGIYYRPDGEY